jgi:hypothetical protein
MNREMQVLRSSTGLCFLESTYMLISMCTQLAVNHCHILILVLQHELYTHSFTLHGQMDTERDRQTDRQTDTHTHTHTKHLLFFVSDTIRGIPWRWVQLQWDPLLLFVKKVLISLQLNSSPILMLYNRGLQPMAHGRMRLVKQFHPACRINKDHLLGNLHVLTF